MLTSMIVNASEKSNNISKNIEGMLKSAKESYNKHEYEEVINVCNSVLQLDEMNSIAYYYRGSAHIKLEQYNRAITDIKNALKIEKKKKLNANVAKILYDLGEVYYILNCKETALNYFKKALELNRQLNREEAAARDLRRIGEIYVSIGTIEKALKNYAEALEIDKRMTREGAIALDYCYIGEVYRLEGLFVKALEYYHAALTIYRRLGSEARTAFVYSNIALVYQDMDDYDKALTYYKKSLAVNLKLGKKFAMIDDYINIAKIHQIKGANEKYLECVDRACNLTGEYGLAIEKVSHYSELGHIYLQMNKQVQAQDCFQKSVDHLEIIRKRIPDKDKSQFLLNWLEVYQDLVSINVSRKQNKEALQVIDLLKGKIARSKISETETTDSIYLYQLQEILSDDQVVIVYFNTNRENVVQISLTNREIKGVKVNIKELEGFKNMAFLYSEEYNQIFYNNQKNEETLTKIILFYLEIFKNSEQEQVDYFTNKLYRFLIEPHERLLEGKKELIIVPDGCLNNLPFDILKDKNNKFLATKFRIKYIHLNKSPGY